MVGVRRATVLAVESRDPVLSFVGALGLALSAGTALVVDLETGSVRGRTLATIATEGPTRHELSPGRPGVAVLGKGPIPVGDAIAVVTRLAEHWPAVVVRGGGGSWPGPTVPYVAMYPGWLHPDWSGTAVWQPITPGEKPPGDGPILPLLRPGLVRSLLSGRMVRRSRWVDAWRQAWGLPWV